MNKELEYIENLFNGIYEATKCLEENRDTIDTSETGQSIIEILEQQNEGLEIVYSIKQILIKKQEMEEQLGCPVDVYVKATINGIIVDGELYSVKIHKDNNGYYFALSNGSSFPFYLSNYQKTWWLRKDKSE